MDVITEVITAAESYDLTVLATVKSELEIAADDHASDAKLSRYIRQASAALATECDRVFARETVRETFRPFYRYPRLALTRRPVTAITSIDADGTVLGAPDFYVQAQTGLLYRLVSSLRSDWTAQVVTVTYTGGYELLGGLPEDIERGVLALVKQYHFAAGRDPAVSEEGIPGVHSYRLRTNGDAAYPPEFQMVADKYRSPVC